MLILLLLWLNSCQKHCITVYLENVRLESYDSLADSSATIIRYIKGTNFQNAKDSSLVNIASVHQSFGPAQGYFAYNFSNTISDYKIIIHPSEKVYEVTDVRFGNEKYSPGCGGSSATTCSYGYTLNGIDHYTDAINWDSSPTNEAPIVIN